MSEGREPVLHPPSASAPPGPPDAGGARASAAQRLRRLVGGDGIGAVGLVLFVTIAVLPIAVSLGYALLYSIGAVGLLSDGLTGAHWQVLVQEAEIWRAFGWSLYIAGATVLLAISLALALALGLHRPLSEGPLSTIIYLPLAIPGTVAAFLVFQLFSGAGWMARVALTLGLIDAPAQFPDLVQDPWGIGIIAAHVGLAVPFFVLLFGQIYESERVRSLMELAATLGASRSQRLYRIAVPILLKRAFTNVLLLFVAVLGSYEIPLLLDQQSPQMLSVLTMRKYGLYDLADKPEAFIIALLYTALVGVVIALAFRYGHDAYDV